jgi:restriction endonuclease S subunit
LLEGLEVSVLKLSEILIDNIDFRVDSEYFGKKYLNFDLFLKSKKSDIISKYAKVSDGDHSKFPDNQKEEVRYLQAKDIKNHFIEDNNPVYISREYFNKNKRSHVTEENVILSIMGSVGDIAITPKGFIPTLANRAVAIIKDIKELNPYYLFTYLSTKYGQLQIDRQKNGGVQERINLDVLSKVKIPFVKNEFQKEIENIVKSSHGRRKETKQAYNQAESILLKEIGLQNYEPSKEPVNIKSFKESYLQNDRIDSEYYQVKYDVIEKTFDKFNRKRILDIINYPVSSGVTPKAGGDDYTDFENGIPFIRAVDLQDCEVLINNCNYIKPNIHNGVLKRTQLKYNDVLLSIAGTVGRAAIFKHKVPANINQAVAILRFDEIDLKRLYLIVFFNTDIGKEFVSKYSRQGVQTNLNLSEVGNLSIPIIDYKKQVQIAELVEESFKLKSESKRLLEVAKRAVEIAIEIDEKTAIKYIKDNTI